MSYLFKKSCLVLNFHKWLYNPSTKGVWPHLCEEEEEEAQESLTCSWGLCCICPRCCIIPACCASCCRCCAAGCIPPCCGPGIIPGGEKAVLVRVRCWACHGDPLFSSRVNNPVIPTACRTEWNLLQPITVQRDSQYRLTQRWLTLGSPIQKWWD